MPVLLLPVVAFVVWLLWRKELRLQWRKFKCYRSGRVLPSHPLAAVVLNTQHGEPRYWVYPGIMVRSRSEKVIAEYLARAGLRRVEKENGC
jgi:hypothetical protein